MEGKAMINSDVPCTQSIKHWVYWWSCPSSERTFGIPQERKDDLFSPENKSCHYSWGVLEKASPCLKQILCKWSCSALRPARFLVPAPQQLHPGQRRNREPSGTHGNWEQDVPVWTVLLDYGSFLAQVWVPVEKSRLLWVTHTAETRPAASLTRISDPAGRELQVHQQGSARHTAVLPVFVTVWQRPDSYTSPSPATGRCIVYMAWKLDSHWGNWAKRKNKLQWNGLQHFPLKRGICCAIKESSKMNLGACSETAATQKRVSNHPVYHPHVQDFILPSLNSAEVKSWLEKPIG